ncbi:hypothetical protein JJQ72_18670 [Paenibacillus sp. F411]|uniref:DUF6075 family protein n=1 Tax=Paenibacillus sp. F411 TaxID=2820239 RepID=UPI001AAFC4CD|nr:DUF6075 family protein [Paenibacillus sp. F411]MBO2946007.1 hypothetical protein [Paenibacillus sp. F411]
MKPPVFQDPEDEAFYYRMLAEPRCTDSYHRALFYTLGLSKDTPPIFRNCLAFPMAASGREGCLLLGKREVPTAYVDWRSISGMVGPDSRGTSLQL